MHHYGNFDDVVNKLTGNTFTDVPCVQYNLVDFVRNCMQARRTVTVVRELRLPAVWYAPNWWCRTACPSTCRCHRFPAQLRNTILCEAQRSVLLSEWYWYHCHPTARENAAYCAVCTLHMVVLIYPSWNERVSILVSYLVFSVPMVRCRHGEISPNPCAESWSKMLVSQHT